ncbi:hypothetical protein [Amycolatopsis sp.]|uniref:hypothetical protein n=1 Tax=Amycolatopsis sp. TaxID=37632 RepID=UPI002D7F4148|nr:hypothetical protein [Amycolatopsis sp.]HET6703782.1 hypothetical protein [Amycolatopsis sp.]
MISAAAGDSTEQVIFLVLMGVVIVAGLTLTIVRAMRSTKSSEEQMARLAAELDGRSQVCIRKIVYTPHQPGRYA